MKILLKRDTRITHTAGEVVEVSPEVAELLIYLDSAEEVKAEPPKEKKRK